MQEIMLNTENNSMRFVYVKFCQILDKWPLNAFEAPIIIQKIHHSVQKDWKKQNMRTRLLFCPQNPHQKKAPMAYAQYWIKHFDFQNTDYWPIIKDFFRLELSS